MNQDGHHDFSSLGITEAFIALDRMGMIRLTTDMNHKLAMFMSMLPAGIEHYDKARKARRSFKAVSDEADELMMALAVQERHKWDKDAACLPITGGAILESYHELEDLNLITIQWGSHHPWFTRITAEGRSYAEGWFEDQMDNKNSFNISVSPQFINNNGSTYANAASEAQSISSSSSDMTLGAAIGSIIDLDITETEKKTAQEALKQLDTASKGEDKQSFSEKLEKVASIAKSSAVLAPILLKFAQTALTHFLG